MTADAAALDLLHDLIGKALTAGADAADALLYDAASLSLTRRLGKIERLERSESCDLGLRVLIGKRQAIVSSSDRSPPALAALVERAVAMARAVPEDPWCGLADPDQLVTGIVELDICDPGEPGAETLIEQVGIAEEAALAVPGVTNSDGADAGWSRSRVALAASNGFSGGYAASRSSLSVVVLAGTGTAMERDYEFGSKVYGSDLPDAATVGRTAGERVVRRLNPRRIKSQKLAVIYDPRVSRGLLSHLAGAISGPSIARGTSFLKDKLGQALFAPGITVIDDPFVRRGLRSRPFDGEGVAPQRRAIIEDGRLTTWLMDLRSARQLGLATTGHASRGTSAPPSPSPANLYLAGGTRSAAELIAEIDEGLYVTELMGQGVNGLTGDYSRGAAGYWIEKGQLAYPVNEITVAGNLKEMFLALEPASDLELRYGVDAPTVRIDSMTIAGL
ncbi:MAG: TldD/PmbA family protein [Rhodospirillaceae bacterium]